MTKKEIILATALELFGERGYDSTSTSQIAKQAGVSEGLIFRHFTNKAGLLTAIMEDGVAQIAATMSAYKTADDPREAIAHHISQSLELIRTHEKFWRFATKVRFQSAVQETASATIDGTNQFIINNLSENFKKTGAARPELEALLLFAVIDAVCIHWLQNPAAYPLDDMKDLLIQKYRYGQF